MAITEGQPLSLDSRVIPDAHVQIPTIPGILVSPAFDRFYKTHRKVMWDLDEIEYDKINPAKLDDDDVEALTTAMKVESHNPVYTMRLLEYFRDDHEMTSFITTWSYEEMKHYIALRTYLEACGKVNLRDLAKDLVTVRSGPWGDMEMGFTTVQTYTYTMVQEQVTGRFYQAFADHTKEEVLQKTLRLIGKDEYRHSAFYQDKGQEELKKSPSVRDEADAVLKIIKMPGPTFIGQDAYSEGAKAMHRKAAPGPIDMYSVLKQVGQLIGYRHLFHLLDQRENQDMLKENWGIELEPVMKMMAPLRLVARLSGA